MKIAIILTYDGSVHFSVLASVGVASCFPVFKQIDKHLPMHLRRKYRKENRSKPNHFEIMPGHGSLSPGQRMNVQIKFMPTEEVRCDQAVVKLELGASVAPLQ